MNDYDRDYYIGTISALANSLSMLNNIIEEMHMRLDELEGVLIEQADKDKDRLNHDIFEDGVAYGETRARFDDGWEWPDVKIGLDTVDDPSYRMD